MARKRPSPAAPNGSAHLFAWVRVGRQPGKEPQLEGINILSERNPTRMFSRVGSAQEQELIHITSESGRDFATARAKLIRRLRRTPAFAWLRPWLDHWQPSSQHRPSPSSPRPMSLAKASAQAD